MQQAIPKMPVMLRDGALAHLKSVLLQLSPAGPAGFEGLAADALAAMTGLILRLARSGLQNGRDAASTPSSAFAIGFEAKLYKGDIGTEDLAGKSVLAGVFLGGKVDLWAVGATAEIGEQTVSTLAPLLEERGVTWLALDWSERPLPPLAVLLTAAKPRVLAWFAKYRPNIDAVALAQSLDAIAADDDFTGQAARLRNDVTASQVGLDALRRHTATWLEHRFTTPALSKQTFGQRITVAAADAPALPRTALVESLGSLIKVDQTDPPVVAVLGGEGAGKTWLVAQWWMAQSDPPILILVAGRRADLLDAADPLTSLARLLAHQDGRTDDATLASWRRRLLRWKGQGASESVRFVVVLDGLNERTNLPWADLILGLALEAQALGGVVVATCREAFWSRDVLPRLAVDATPATLTVPDFSDTELASQLARVDKKLSDLPVKVRLFIRNPRICAVAIGLLDRLSPEALSVESLHLEYLRARLAERGDGLRHTIGDFNKLLRGHARAWLSQPRRAFPRDDWTDHSGAAKRLGVRDVADDLTEIVEGRFLNPIPGDLEAYTFRPEALPFALGLLINDELRQALVDDMAGAEEVLERIIDPVKAFDQFADILGAAAVLACGDQEFPADGRRALISAWIGLQNLPDEAFETMAAALLARPSAFMDVAELSRRALGSGLDHRLIALLVQLRDHPDVQLTFAQRVERWLGLWSRQTRRHWGDDKDAAARQVRRDASIDEAWAKLSASELALVRQLTSEVAEPAETPLDHAVALILAGRPQIGAAAGLVGWAIADTLGGDFPDGRAELEWSVRLNAIDWVEVKAAVVQRLAEVTVAASDPIREAAANALRLLGDLELDRAAEELWPATGLQHRRFADRYNPVDPLDPTAAAPNDLGAALEALETLKLGEMWCHMSATSEDHTLEAILPLLARFGSDALIAKLNGVVHEAAERTGLPLRQLGWHLPWMAPLLDADAKLAVRKAITGLIADPARAPKGDLNFVLGQLVSGLTPSASAEDQLELLLALPRDFPLYLHLRRGAKALAATALQAHLEAAKEQDAETFMRVMFFASASKPQLTNAVRALVLDAMFGEDRTLAACAADVVFQADDKALNMAVLERAAPRNDPAPSDPEDAFAIGRAIAVAVVKEQRGDLLSRVSPRFVDWAACKLGDAGLDRLTVQTEAVVLRLLQPVSADPPEGVNLYYGAAAADLDATVWAEPASDREPSDDPLAVLKALNDSEGWARRDAERRTAIMREVRAYKAALTAEQASAIASVPPNLGLGLLAARDPKLTEGWITRILAVTDARVRAQIKNLAVALAGAHAAQNGALAGEVFEAFGDAKPITRVVVGAARLPFETRALFGAGQVEALDPLRRQRIDRALSDADLETIVATVEAVGASAWLDAYVEERIDRPEPTARARALTLAGLRSPNGQSSSLLARDWGCGFLGLVVQAARAAYSEGERSLQWLAAWRSAQNPAQFWCLSQMLEGVADRRTVMALDGETFGEDLIQAYGDEVFERVRKAAEKRSKARGDTLFGQKGPVSDLAALL